MRINDSPSYTDLDGVESDEAPNGHTRTAMPHQRVPTIKCGQIFGRAILLSSGRLGIVVPEVRIRLALHT
jgi:hypothetical protein